MKMATKKISAAKIAEAKRDLSSLYAKFDAATTEAERKAISAQLVQLAFNPDATLASVTGYNA